MTNKVRMSGGLEQPIDGDVRVHVAASGMEAYVTVIPPKNGGRPATFDLVMNRLRQAGVVEGIMFDQIAEALKEENWGKMVQVARGVPPKDGEDAKIEYRFPLPEERIRPATTEDDRVDYRNLNLIQNVRKGELLAVRIPPTLGVPGIAVTGKKVFPRPGRNTPLPRGRNTFCDEEGNRLYAAVDGHVSIVDNKITVFPVFELNGDVDYSSGNIDFVGNVVVNGNVLSGFTVKAGGDIQVGGIIEGATVTAGGNILVKGGITGGYKGVVVAGGSVFARFIENATVEAGLDVVVKDAILQSTVKAGNSIRVEGRKGTIVGGLLQAGNEISAAVIGSSLSPTTVLEVGVKPELRLEYRCVIQQWKEKKKLYDAIAHHLQTYQMNKIDLDELPEKRKANLIKLLENLKTVKEELARLEARRDELESEFEQLQKGRVKAAEMVYPGVQITIGQAVYQVNDPVKYALFTLEQGEVKLGSL